MLYFWVSTKHNFGGVYKSPKKYDILYEQSLIAWLTNEIKALTLQTKPDKLSGPVRRISSLIQVDECQDRICITATCGYKAAGRLTTDQDSRDKYARPDAVFSKIVRIVWGKGTSH